MEEEREEGGGKEVEEKTLLSLCIYVHVYTINVHVHVHVNNMYIAHACKLMAGLHWWFCMSSISLMRRGLSPFLRKRSG